jgi:DNA-binding GntR family transcriptional regulator
MHDRHHSPIPAQLRTANESVYHALKRDIVSGVLPPGTRLVHRKVAERMGTSNIPVVDALRRLEGAGLLVTIPGVGTCVRQWQPHEVDDLCLIRASLDAIACRLFVERATGVDRAALDTYEKELDAAAEAGDVDEFVGTDERLHLHVTRATGSSELFRLLENSGLILVTIQQKTHPAPLCASTLPLRVGIHQPLVRALKSDDPDWAELEGRAHALNTIPERMRRWLEELRDQHVQ